MTVWHILGMNNDYVWVNMSGLYLEEVMISLIG